MAAREISAGDRPVEPVGRRWGFAAGFAIVAAATLGSSAGLAPVTADTIPAAVPLASPLFLVAPAVATNPSVSGNGRFVAFTSAPGQSATETDDRVSSVWLSDRFTGEITELTLPKEGTRLGNSVNPVIAADGCTVVVTTETAYDLFRDDDEGLRWDVYRTTLPSCDGKVGDWAIVSTYLNADGQAQARNDVDPDQLAAVSSSGSVIAYVRPFESLSGSDDVIDPAAAIDVVDLTIPVDDAGRITEAPGLPSELALNSVTYVGQVSPALSADGSTLVFTSDATADDAVSDWVTPVGAATTVATQIFAWNRNDLDPFTAVEMISTNSTDGGNASSFDPTVSADGRIIAFSSAASDLINAESLRQCGAACPAQIYVVDRDPDLNGINDEAGLTSLTLITRAPGDGGSAIMIGNGASFAPALSADGISVAFATQASNLLQVQTPGGGALGDGDLVIADLANGNQLRRAFDGLTPAPGAHGNPHISANGRVLVADSLVAGELLGDPGLVGRHIVAATYAPVLSIASLDIGTVLVSVPGPEWRVYVVNAGPGSFTPKEINLDNPDFVISGGSCVTDQAPVKPGTSCEIKVIFTPSVVGPITATLTVAEQGYGGIILTAPVKGAGGEPSLGADPSFAVYGTEVVGRLSQFTEIFTVSNVSVTPTVVMSATMSGANPDDFIVTASTCGTELTLAASCPVEVSFRPTGPGRRTATLSFATALGQYTSVLLSGDGVYVPTLLASPELTPGQDLGVGGSGFPANTDIVIGWSDGSGRSATVTTNDEGGFLLNLATKRSQSPGAATLVAQASDGTSATVVVDVQQDRRRSPRQRG